MKTLTDASPGTRGTLNDKDPLEAQLIHTGEDLHGAAMNLQEKTHLGRLENVNMKTEVNIERETTAQTDTPLQLAPHIVNTTHVEISHHVNSDIQKLPVVLGKNMETVSGGTYVDSGIQLPTATPTKIIF